MKKKILGWVFAGLFLLGMAFFSIPDIFLRRFVNTLVRADAPTRRRTETDWQLRWARFYHRLILPLANIQMPIRIQGEIPRGPYILISNHRTALDGLIVAMVVERLGLTHVLWIVKEEIRIVSAWSSNKAGVKYVHMTFGNALIIAIHALVAWTLIEMFVNYAHRLSRASFVVCHYLVVVVVFAGVFSLYSALFDIGASAFVVTVVGMSFILLFEFIVFRFLYSGERWFLNWVDWMFPIFLATSTIYAVVSLW